MINQDINNNITGFRRRSKETVDSRGVGNIPHRVDRQKIDTADSKSRNRRSQSKDKETKAEPRKKETIMSYLDRVKHEMFAK